MNNTHRFSLLIAIAALIFSCEEQDSPGMSSEEYLVFGKFYGFCLGDNCVQIFKIESNQLSKNKLHQYPARNSFYPDTYDLLSNTKFESVSGLLDIFPDRLLNETDTIFGCPDCADQGGYYIEANFAEIRKFWIIDTSRSNVPEYLHPFLDEIDAAIEIIEN